VLFQAAAEGAAIPDASPLLRVPFVLLCLAMAGLFVWAVHTSASRTGASTDAARRQALTAAAATTLWLAATAAAASAGVLRFTEPPTMFPVLALTLALAVGTGLSPLGRRLAVGLPLAALVGFQAFRIVVELLLHRAYTEGLMPVQMSYAGRNFDVVSGVTALAVALWLATGHAARWVVLAWNTLGLALLANIVAIALLSAPTPFRVFMNEPANVWVTRAPWVWLPAVLVLSGLLGHLLVYRRLLIDAGAAGRSALRSASLSTG
jgi:hypothetical protein